MKRRDFFKHLSGASILMVAAAETSSTRRIVILNPVLVQRNSLRVVTTPEGQTFSIVVLGKPWPSPGDEVRHEWDGKFLTGVVHRTRVWFPSHHHGGFLSVTGSVITFESRAVLRVTPQGGVQSQ
jgi:hypothetical protein